MTDHHGLAEAPQAVLHILDVIGDRHASQLGDATAAVMAAEIEGPGVPAHLGGGMTPRAQTPGAHSHAVNEKEREWLERPHGRRVLEDKVSDTRHFG